MHGCSLCSGETHALPACLWLVVVALLVSFPLFVIMIVFEWVGACSDASRPVHLHTRTHTRTHTHARKPPHTHCLVAITIPYKDMSTHAVCPPPLTVIPASFILRYSSSSSLPQPQNKLDRPLTWHTHTGWAWRGGGGRSTLTEQRSNHWPILQPIFHPQRRLVWQHTITQ